jgi:uncharacterized repeat protein (TIGR01451 family)/gliding motility-associated-like protein
MVDQNNIFMKAENNNHYGGRSIILRNLYKYTILLIALVLLSFSQVKGQAIILDLNNSQLSFLNSNRVVLVNTGNSGRNQGSVHRYNNVVTKDGITVYAKLTIQEVNNATITNFDDDNTYGIPARFQPRIGVLSSAGGYIVYHLQFFNQATDQDVFIYNYYLTGVDVDGNSSSNREFNEHGGYTSYTVNNPTQLVISTNSTTGRTRFLGRTTSLDGLNFDNSASYIMNYMNPNNVITFALGQTGQNDERYYSLNFGSKGGTFTNPDTHTNPLPLAIDDIGIPVNSNTGGVAISNVLSNDLYNGLPINASDLDISLINGASNSGITLNTTTGVVSVAPNTPAGTYTLVYQICMKANPAGRCDLATVTVYVREANLSITKTDSPDPVLAGQNLTYTITVMNNGPTEASNVEVTDNLPSGLTFISATPSNGSWSGNKWTIGTLANTSIATLTIVAKVAGSFSGNIINTATVSSTTYDPVSTNNTATQSTTVNKSANLSIIKTDSPDPAVAGQGLTYSITVSNLGPSDASSVVVSDIIPSGVTLVSANSSAGTWNSPTWNIPSIAAGSSVNLTISTLIGANLSGTISNTAIIQSSGTPDPDNTNNSSTQSTVINTSADISIVKLLTSGQLIAGQSVSYSLTVSNAGPSNSQSIQLTDGVPSEINQVQFSIDGGVNWSNWSSPYSVGTLNAGSSRQILLRGNLIANAMNGSTLINSASVSSSTPDPNTSNNNSSVAGIVNTRSDMSILKTGPSTIIAGTKITYSLTVINNGPSYAANISIADAVPSGITNVEYSLNNGNSWGTWNGTRNLPVFNFPGENDILIRGDVASGLTGNLINSATVSTTTNDPVSTNNSSTITTQVNGSADLVISKTQTISPLKKNGPVNYILTVLNNGPSDATNITLTDNIDSSIITGVEYNNGSSWVPWTGTLFIGNILNGATYVLQIRGNVTNAALDPVVNTASVNSSSVPDPILTNNTVTISSLLDTEADLRVTKTSVSSINAGENIQYSILVENLSPNMNASNVLISDNLDDAKINSIEYSADGGLNWSSWLGSLNIGTLNFGSSKTLLIRGQVLSNSTGTIVNTATVSSSTSDPITANNSSTVTTLINVNADIAVEKSIITAPSNIVAGSVIEYLVKYRNDGPSDASNYLITDLVPSGLQNVEASRCQSAFNSWPGTFNAGTVVANGSCTILIRGTITSNFSGLLTNTVSVTSNATDANPSNNTSQVSSLVNSNSDLKISISVLQNPVISGNDINYSVTVENLGTSDAQNVSVASISPSGIQNILYSLDGTTWNGWTGNYLFGTLVNGGGFTFYLKGTTLSSLTNGSLLTEKLTVSSSTNDPNVANNSAQVSATMQTNSDLMIVKSVDQIRPSIGDQVVYNLRVTNRGVSNASGVTVSDQLPSGVHYLSSAGNGSYNQLTGVWNIGNLAVSDSVELIIRTEVNNTGTYNNLATVNGDDLDTDLSNNSSSIEIIPDIESVYTVYTPQNVDSYLNSQILARVNDQDGNIVSAEILAGSLPGGTSMNLINGTISVINSSLLISGSYTFTVKTVDAIGGTTIQPVTVIIGPDIEAVYWVTPVRNVDDFGTGEYLASVIDGDGEIISTTINTGTLPTGTIIDPVTGTLLITDPGLLVAGSYPLNITTIDNTGGHTTQSITVIIGPDIEALYHVYAAKIVDSYKNGDTLATVQDGDGALAIINLLNSDPHAGINFDQSTGVITVLDSSLLLPGIFNFETETKDVTGGRSLPKASIVINPDIESVYHVQTARNVDSYRNNDVLATVSDGNGILISANILTGLIPTGTSINSITGEIIVTNSAILVAGTYPISIKTIDEKGGITIQTISIIINPDIESIYTEVPTGNVFDYSNNQSLATVFDADGNVVNAEISSGTLPPGTSINPVTGNITVLNSTLLEAGSYTFQVTTTDITGGITVQPVTISFLAADLKITKVINPSFIIAGESLSYTITVTNIGPNQALNVSVIDHIPSELSVISVHPSVGSWNSSEWTIGDMANGKSETLTINASLPSSSTGILTNSASVSSLTSDPDLTNNSDTNQATVNSLADLAVNITDLNDPVLAGDSVEYTITVNNVGPSDVHEILLIDNLPSELMNNKYSIDGGITWLDWTGSLIHHLLGAGDNYTIKLKSDVHAGTENGHVLLNSVSVSSLTPDANLSNNSSSEETVIEKIADMSVEKSGPSTVIAGNKITWSLTVINHGPSWADTVSIADAIPLGVSHAEYSLNNGNSWGVWNGTRNLPLFETNPGVNNILLRGDLATGYQGELTNIATVTSKTSDPSPGNNLSSFKTQVTYESDLALTKEVLTSPIKKNQLVTYKISVINLGPSDAYNVQLIDQIDVTQITGAEYSLDNGASWAAWNGSTSMSVLPHNEIINLLIKGTITNDADNPLYNTAIVNSSNNDPNLQNNRQTINTPLEIEADLSITKTAVLSVNAGDTISYLITVVNNSPNMDASDVILTDNVDHSKVESPLYSADGGNTWNTWAGTYNFGIINHGIEKTLLIKGKVMNNSTGVLVNSAHVTSGVSDPDLSNNVSEVTTQITQLADISVIKELLTPASEVIAGNEIRYLITYYNSGPSDATNFTITDNVPSGLTDVESSRCRTAFVPWHGSFNAGTVVAGGTCTILIRANIKSEEDGILTNNCSVLSEVSDPDMANNNSSVDASIASLADISITKIADKEPVIAGENITYTIHISNNGPSNAQNVTVTDILPAGLTILSSVPSKGSWLSPVWSAGMLMNGENAELTIIAKVGSNAGQGSVLINTAKVTTTTTDPVSENNQATEVTSVASKVNLTVVKSGSPNPVFAGDEIAYSIQVTNNGPSDAKDIVITDNLPSEVSFVSASGNGVNSNGLVSWTLGSLPAGNGINYVLEVKTSSNLPGGAVIINRASAVAAGEEIVESDPTLINVINHAELSVVKLAESDHVLAGEEIGYTIIVTNNGPSKADNIKISDELPPDVAFVSASGGGIFHDGMVTWSRDNLVLNEQEIVTLVVKVNANVSAGSIIVNRSTVESDDSDPVTSDPSEVIVDATSNFRITKTASNPVIIAGKDVTYTIRMTNFGPGNAENVLITDTLATGLRFIEGTDNPTYANGIVKWIIPTLLNGQTKVVTLTAQVLSEVPAGTRISNIVTMIPEGGDTITGDPEIITISNHTNLVLFKSASVSQVDAGRDYSYTLSISNSGPSSARNIVISDVVPSGVTFVSVTNGGVFSNGSVRWNLNSLKKDSVVNFSFTVNVLSTIEPGTIIRNMGTAREASNNPISSNTVDVIVTNRVNLSLYKIAEQLSVFAGDEINYSIRITNNGPSLARHLDVYDVIPEGTTFIEAFDGGIYYTDRVIWNIESIGAGESLTLKMTIRVNSNVPQGTYIHNVAVAINGNGDDPDKSNPVDIPVSVKADLEITKTGWPKPVNAGDDIIYTFKIKNNGPSDALGVYVKDVLSSELAFVGIESGTATWQDSILSIGTIHANETVIVSIRAKVDQGTPNGKEIVNTAVVSSSVIDPDFTNNSSTDKTLVSTMSDISITKSGPSGVIAGTRMNYYLNVFNAGPSNAQTVIVTDTVTSSLTNVMYSLNGGITWENWTGSYTIGEIQAGKLVSILLRGDLNASATGSIRNTAIVNTSTFDPNPDNNIDTEVTPIIIEADISINKTGPVSVVAGQEVVYTFTITPGTSDATNVIITDIIPNGISNAKYSLDNGLTWINWPVNNQIQIGTIYSGDPIQLLLKGLVSSEISGMIMNTVILETESYDPDLLNNADSVGVDIIPLADIIISKTDGQEEYIPGTNVVYTVTVHNIGPSIARGVKIIDSAPTGTNIITWTATGTSGTEYNDSGTGNINEIVSIPDEGTIIYRVTVSIPSNQQGLVENISSVIIPDSFVDPNLNNNVANDIDAPNTKAKLTVKKISNVREIAAGENVTYTILVTNNGPAIANHVEIIDTLASGLTFMNASSGGVSEGNSVRWEIASLANGASFTMSVEVKVNSNVSEGTIIRNIAVAGSDNTPDPPVSDPIDITVINQSRLTIDKNSSASTVGAGDKFYYTIKIVNQGPSDVTDVAVRDTLPESLQFVEANHDGILTNGVVGWNIASIAAGDSILVKVFVTTPAELAGGTKVKNVAVLQKPGGDPLPSKPIVVTITNRPAFEIVKDGLLTVVAGEEFNYSIKVTNSSSTMARNVIVSDTLKNGLMFTTASGGFSNEGNIVTWRLDSLAGGDIQEFNVTVTTDASLAKGTVLSNTAIVTSEDIDTIYRSNEIITTIKDGGGETKVLVANDDIGIPVVGLDGGIALSNVLLNDFYGKDTVTLQMVTITQLFSTSEKIVLDIKTGEVIVEAGTPAGNYEVDYRICLNSDQQMCDEAKVIVVVLAPTISANDDNVSEFDNSVGGIAITDVTDNDLLNGLPFDISEVIVSIVSPSTVAGISLSTQTGEVNVAKGTPTGSYQITYQICDVINPSVCDNAIINITVTDGCEMVVPTGFSPNGDSYNERFEIPCIEKYPDAKIEIFNRWGNLVFKKEHYGNVDFWGEANAWWDGTSSNNWDIGGDKLPPGTYFYVLDLGNGAKKPLAGSIFINR